MHMLAMNQVYSYSRFSTPEQSQGNSLRRQSDAAAKWAEDRGLILDDTLRMADEGVSAYRGTNTDVDKGLGLFLYACREGLIETGSYLLVENLDRISRMTPRKAQALIGEIVDAGVTIVTLSDGQEYTAKRLDNDPIALLIMLMVSWRAHEESKVKGRRVAAAWAAKRERVRSGQDRVLTARAPAWLAREGQGWRVVENRAAIVKRIYAMTLAGAGEHSIAGALNAEGVPVMGRGMMWHRSSISKILRNPAVIGRLIPGRIEYIDGKRRRVTEEPIDEAFPPVISMEDWAAVCTLKDGKAASQRGRHAARPLTNILAGLAKCPDCGSTMTRVYKGAKNGNPKLVCTKAKAGAADHPYTSVNLEEVTQAFMSDWQILLIDIPAGERGPDLDRQFLELSTNIDALQDHLQELLIAVEAAPSAALAVRIRTLEEEIKTYKALHDELEDRRYMVDGGVSSKRMSDLADAMEAESLDIPKVNAALKVLFSQVTIDHHKGWLRFHWRQGGEVELIYKWMD